jgi:hypothetical protein
MKICLLFPTSRLKMKEFSSAGNSQGAHHSESLASPPFKNNREVAGWMEPQLGNNMNDYQMFLSLST